MAATSHPVLVCVAGPLLLLACGSSPAAVSSVEGGPLDSASQDGMPDGSLGDGFGGPDGTLGDAGGQLDGPGTGTDGAPVLDANPDAPLVQPMCSAWQTYDAGAYGNLATLPIAELCAQSFFDSAYESVPCQGTILVSWSTGADSGSFDLYDAGTGALVAVGSAFMSGFSCDAVAPGFQFPFQCLNNGGWYPQWPICTDAAAADAALDAPLETGD